MTRTFASFLLLALVACSGETAVQSSPSPLPSPSPTFQTLREWYSKSLPQLNEFQDSLKPLSNTYSENADNLQKQAEAARRLSIAMRSAGEPPASAKIDVTAATQALDEFDQTARDAAACSASCQQIYDRFNVAQKSVLDSLKRLLAQL